MEKSNMHSPCDKYGRTVVCIYSTQGANSKPNEETMPWEQRGFALRAYIC